MARPVETVQAFLGALHREDFPSARQCLGGPFSFVGWFGQFDDPDRYLEALRKVRGFIVKADVHKLFADGPDVCLLYDAHTRRGDVTLVAGWFKLSDDKITSIRVVCDPKPFAELWAAP